MRAFLVTWRSLLSVYNELFLLIGISLLWWLTGGFFLALAVLVGYPCSISAAHGGSRRSWRSRPDRRRPRWRTSHIVWRASCARIAASSSRASANTGKGLWRLCHPGTRDLNPDPQPPLLRFTT